MPITNLIQRLQYDRLSTVSVQLAEFEDQGKTCKLHMNGSIKSHSMPICMVKGKAVPLQAWTGPEGSRKLRFPDFVIKTQDGGRLSALRTGRLYPRKYSWYSCLLEVELTPGL